MLRRIPYVTIATISPQGQPWNTPVVGRFDENLNLYWVSWRKSRHSQNIDIEPRIFVVLYDTDVPEGSGEGLYLQMHACTLRTPLEIAAAKKIYDTSFFAHPFGDHEQFLDSCPQRMYKAVPQKIWHNTDGTEQGHFVDRRQEVAPQA